MLDFETNFETAMKTILSTVASGSSTTQFVASLDQVDFTTPRIEINAELQGAEDPPTKNNAGVLNYSQYSLNLVIRVVSDLSDNSTDPITGLTPGGAHRSMRKQVREAMLLSANNFTSEDNRGIEISGAGSSIANGIYILVSSNQYRLPGLNGMFLVLNSTNSEWEIYQSTLSGTTKFYTTTNAPSSPGSTDAAWALEAGGSNPLPTSAVGPILTDYEVKYMRPAGTDFDIDGDLGISTLTYDIKFACRPSQWEI